MNEMHAEEALRTPREDVPLARLPRPAIMSPEDKAMTDPLSRFRLPCLAALAAFLLLAPSARADIVKLKNGNSIEGKILEEGEESVILRTTSGGTMTFRRDAVESVERRDDLEEETPEEDASAKKPAPKKPAPGTVRKPPPKKPPAKKAQPAKPPMKRG